MCLRVPVGDGREVEPVLVHSFKGSTGVDESWPQCSKMLPRPFQLPTLKGRADVSVEAKVRAMSDWRRGDIVVRKTSLSNRE